MHQQTRAIVALIALAFSTFLYVTTEALPIGLLGLIARDLNTAPASVGLLVTGYGLVVVVGSVPLTRLTSGWPRRRVLGGVLAVLTVTAAASAAAPGYPGLLVSRLFTAMAQALFWSVVTPAAAALFEPRLRGRAIALVNAGSAAAGVLGVPAGTWLGQQAGWRAAFLAVAGLGLLLLVTLVLVLPNASAAPDTTALATAPDARRYWAMVATTALVVTGAFAGFTYISPFLTGVTGFSAAAIGPILLVRGVAALATAAAIGFFVEKHAWAALVALTGVMTVALGSQYWWRGSEVAVVVSAVASGAALSGLASALGARMLQVAPGDTNLASAWLSTAFNVGISGGALVASLLLGVIGAAGTPLLGAGFTLAGLAVLLAEPKLAEPKLAKPKRSQPRRSSARAGRTPAGPRQLVRK